MHIDQPSRRKGEFLLTEDNLHFIECRLIDDAFHEAELVRIGVFVCQQYFQRSIGYYFRASLLFLQQESMDDWIIANTVENANILNIVHVGIFADSCFSLYYDAPSILKDYQKMTVLRHVEILYSCELRSEELQPSPHTLSL